jgi:hypothetical protein
MMMWCTFGEITRFKACVDSVFCFNGGMKKWWWGLVALVLLVVGIGFYRLSGHKHWVRAQAKMWEDFFLSVVKCLLNQKQVSVKNEEADCPISGMTSITGLSDNPSLYFHSEVIP